MLGIIDWFKRNNEIHGWAMIALTMLVYSGQGGRAYIQRSLGWISQYGFGENSGATQNADAIGRIPWNFKFVIGLVSDNLPIFGYNVKPWMVIAALTGLSGQIMYGWEQFTPNLGMLTIAFVIIQTYGSTADCLADALVVKNGRHDEADSSSGLQSLSWFSFGVGNALFTFIGSRMSTDTTQPNNVSVKGARDYNKLMIMFPISLLLFMFFLKEEKTKFRPSFKALFQQLVRLFVALFSPPFLVLRTMFWVVVARVSAIDLTFGMQAFTTTFINIKPDEQGLIDISII
jgi:hypothetical protein